MSIHVEDHSLTGLETSILDRSVGILVISYFQDQTPSGVAVEGHTS